MSNPFDAVEFAPVFKCLWKLWINRASYDAGEPHDSLFYGEYHTVKAMLGKGYDVAVNA